MGTPQTRMCALELSSETLGGRGSVPNARASYVSCGCLGTYLPVRAHTHCSWGEGTYLCHLFLQ